MRARFVNEEKLDTIYTGDKFFEVFKNPKNVKRMDWWARAFSDYKGNFYVITYKDSQITSNYDAVMVTHTHLQNFLVDKRYVNLEWKGMGGYGYYTNGLAWQRYGKTADWYLSESMDVDWIESNQKQIKENISLIDKRHINYLNLHPSRITEREDEDVIDDDIEFYHREQAKKGMY